MNVILFQMSTKTDSSSTQFTAAACKKLIYVFSYNLNVKHIVLFPLLTAKVAKVNLKNVVHKEMC